MLVDTLKSMKNEYERLAEDRREKYPYEYRAPYEGYSAAVFEVVTGNFVWVPFRSEGYALFMFDDEADCAAFADIFDDVAEAA